MSVANPNAAPGLHAETLKALKSKRDPEMEATIFKWMACVLGEKVPALQGTPYEEELKSGVLLCKVMNKLSPGSISNYDKDPKHSYKMIENISKFVKAAEKWGVADIDLFQTTDLIDARNIPQVTNTILAVARACYNHPEYQGPYLGPKPSS